MALMFLNALNAFSRPQMPIQQGIRRTFSYVYPSIPLRLPIINTLRLPINTPLRLPCLLHYKLFYCSNNFKK